MVITIQTYIVSIFNTTAPSVPTVYTMPVASLPVLSDSLTLDPSDGLLVVSAMSRN